MKLIKSPEGEYIYFCRYEERKTAFGFSWDKQNRVWRTRNPAIALRCAAYADDSLRAELLAEAKNAPNPDVATLRFSEGVWRWFGPIRLNSIPKSAGFRATDKPYWHWWSESLEAAVRCYQLASTEIPDEFVCDGEAQAILAAAQSQKIGSIKASRSLAADISTLPPYAVPDPSLGFELLPCQVAAVLYGKDKDVMLFGDEMRIGKAQPLDSMIITPRGPEPMEWMRPGTTIIGRDGKTHYVTGVFPQGVKDVYCVTFSDGSAANCCADHLWEVNSPLRKWRGTDSRVLSTIEIARTLTHSNGNNQHFIPLVSAVEFAPLENPLPLNPYLLGALLGDGCLRSGVSFSAGEEEIAGRVAELLPYGTSLRYKSGCDYRIVGRGVGQQNTVIDVLRALNLFDTKSNNKFIPLLYKLASIREREAILQGLMDTDGYVSKHNVVQFCSVSPRLIADVKFLVQSLGGVARESSKRTNRQLAYNLTLALPPNIQPFRITRKAARYKPRPKFPASRAVVSIEFAGRMPVQCISTTAPDGLYLTDNFILTHNTPESICWANCHRDIRRVLIITKKTIKLNWKREWERWSTLGLSVEAAWGMSDWPTTDVVIVNAQILGRPKDAHVEAVLLKSGKPKMKQSKKGPVPATKKVYPLRKEIADIPWDLVIVDECHEFKTTGTAKQQYLLALQPPHRALLTGTLTPNGRAIEIWPALNWLDPEGFPEKDKFKWALRYAGAKRTPFGWDMSGVTHAAELQQTLRQKYMVRRLFADVYKEIPKRRRQLIEFPCPDDRFINEQDALWKRYTTISSAVKESVDESEATVVLDEHREKVRGLDSEKLACFEEMSQMRHEDAIKRIPFLVEHLKGLLEESPKVVCAAWHNDVVEQIAAEFPGCVTIYGKTPGNQRVAMQDHFNNDPAVTLCVVGIAVCEGLDLSSSSVMVMGEQSWVPKDIQQAEARIENPFKKDSCLIQYCVFQGSLDAHMAQTLVYKEEAGYDVLDREIVGMAELTRVAEPETSEVVLPEKREATGPETPFDMPSLPGTPSFVAPAGPALSKEDCEAIHAAVRSIAARCDGGATKDHQGFNLVDIRVGHSLAASERLSEGGARLALKILAKYRGQLNGQIERFYE